MRDLGHFPELLSCLFLITYERLFVDKMWIKQHPEKLFRFSHGVLAATSIRPKIMPVSVASQACCESTAANMARWAAAR